MSRPLKQRLHAMQLAPPNNTPSQAQAGYVSQRNYINGGNNTFPNMNAPVFNTSPARSYQQPAPAAYNEQYSHGYQSSRREFMAHMSEPNQYDYQPQ